MVKAGLHKATSLMSKTVRSSAERFFHRMTNLFNSQASSLQLSVQIFTLSYVTTTVIWKKSTIFKYHAVKNKTTTRTRKMNFITVTALASMLENSVQFL